MIDADELALLTASALNMGGDGRVVPITVHGCAYSCCGRPWHRRDGYWQNYSGWIDNLQLTELAGVGTFMLYASGIGTLSYVIAVRFDEVESVG